MNEIAVFVRNGRIVVDFSQGNLHVHAINLAAKIKRLPDIDTVIVQRDGSLSVKLASVKDVAALQSRIAALANSYTAEAPEAPASAQLSLF